MFTKGWEKIAAFKLKDYLKLKNYIQAVAHREIKIDEALGKAVKAGKSAKRSAATGRIADPGADSVSHTMSRLRGYTENPISMEMLEEAKKRGLNPEGNVRNAIGRYRNRSRGLRQASGSGLGTRRDQMKSLSEHATLLQKSTRDPIEMIHGEAKEKAKLKIQTAKRWGELEKKLRALKGKAVTSGKKPAAKKTAPVKSSAKKRAR